MAQQINHMPTFIAERAALAVTYAQDGAYNSAWRILASLADAVGEHAKLVNEAQERLLAVAPISSLRDAPLPPAVNTASPPPPNAVPAPQPVPGGREPPALGWPKAAPIGRDYLAPTPLAGTTPRHRHIWHYDTMNNVRTCDQCGAEEPL